MGTGTSLVLIAAGAIMRYAVTATATGFNIHTVGLILMIVGAVGFVISLFFWNSWGGFGGVGSGRTVVTHSETGYVNPSQQPVSTGTRTVVTRTDQEVV